MSSETTSVLLRSLALGSNEIGEILIRCDLLENTVSINKTGEGQQNLTHYSHKTIAVSKIKYSVAGIWFETCFVTT